MAMDPLEDLLRDVDAAAGPGPPRDGQLPERVRQLDRRRRRRKIALGGSATAVLLVALAVPYLPGRRDPAPIWPPLGRESPSVAEHSELPRLEAELANLESQLAALLATERHVAATGQLRRIAPPPNREERVRRQLDLSAATVLAGAEVKYHRLSLTDSAAVDYRRVCEMYPDTISAETAAVRLAEICRGLPEEPAR